MKYLISIDVEDWFQVENLKGAIARETWDNQELRIEANMDWILNELDSSNTKCTFFILGWIAEKLPQLVKHIHAAGHEIASHGYGHELIYKHSREVFAQDLERSRKFLEDLTGERILGYRAPSFSITDFAIDVLRDQGFRYDSSLFLSIKHDRYGRLKEYPTGDKPVFPLAENFYEITLSCHKLLGKNIPWAGGGYFRLFPYWLFKPGIAEIAAKEQLYSFYIHPWEFDPGQPKIQSIKASYRFRHYNNLHRTKQRFSDMLRAYPFEPMRNALPMV